RMVRRSRPRIMNVKRLTRWAGAGMKAWWPHLVARFAEVVSVLAVGIVYAVEFPEHPEKIRLAFEGQSSSHSSGVLEPLPTQVLAVDHCLGVHQLLIKAVQGQPGGQHGVLYI